MKLLMQWVALDSSGSFRVRQLRAELPLFSNWLRHKTLTVVFREHLNTDVFRRAAHYQVQICLRNPSDFGVELISIVSWFQLDLKKKSSVMKKSAPLPSCRSHSHFLCKNNTEDDKVDLPPPFKHFISFPLIVLLPNMLISIKAVSLHFAKNKICTFDVQNIVTTPIFYI